MSTAIAGIRFRSSRPDDFEALVTLRNVGLHPVRQWTVEHRRQWEATTRDSDTLLEVAVDAFDRVVALGELDAGGSFRQSDGTLFTNLRVAPSHRRRGIGTVLGDRIERTARARGAPRLLATVPETEPEALAWAVRLGWQERWRQNESYLHISDLLRDVFAVAPPVGVAIVGLPMYLASAGRDAGIAALHQLYRTSVADTPGNPEPPFSEAGFRSQLVEGPLAAPDLSFVALSKTGPVGVTINSRRGPSRAHTAFTGTHRDWRRRGVARALKAAALLRARESGIRVMLTANDGTNVPMLRLNEWLGYAPLPAIVHIERALQ
ncbi:MAG TPA: GNAT family N-acetyltransferase [Candidatus Limnocylindria bacterium]|nr:GNAT family N-acetyltransferase [Candidatus Limnocylindria bacterium]